LLPGVLALREEESAPVPAGHARVAVAACGVCGTDLHLLDGMRLPPGPSYPVHPGHEVAGTIVELGDDDGATMGVGTPVVLHPLVPCGTCELCSTGQAERCANKLVQGVHLPGALASDLVWPVSRMVAVPGLDLRQAAVLADAVATSKRALDAARVPQGGALCVVGAGGVGTHVLQLARIADPSCRLTGVVRSEVSAQRLVAAGFEAVVGLDYAALRRRGPFDAVIDFSGDRAGPALGMKVLQRGGVYVLGSVFDGPLMLGAAQRLQTRALTVAGIVSSSLDDLRAMADLALSGALDLSASITQEYPIEDVALAFRALRDRPPGTVRIVVTMS
jgi:propanol-preferring alcohol dehydrogenase